jgi:hypothetical protein
MDQATECSPEFAEIMRRGLGCESRGSLAKWCLRRQDKHWLAKTPVDPPPRTGQSARKGPDADLARQRSLQPLPVDADIAATYEKMSD